MIKETYWSRFAQEYEKKQAFVVGKGLLDDIIKDLTHLTGLGDLVEFGCGTGFFTKRLAGQADQMIASDFSDELLKIAALNLNTFSNICVQKENCLGTSFEPERFDTVFMANLIHVVDLPSKAVQESHRILKHKGRLIIVTYTTHGMTFWETLKLGIRFLMGWGKPPGHVHTFSPETLGSLLEKSGFQIKESKLVGSKTKAVFLVAQKV